MTDYLLTFQIKMNACDDIEARQISRSIIESFEIDQLKPETYIVGIIEKLQEIKDNAPPRKIEL